MSHAKATLIGVEHEMCMHVAIDKVFAYGTPKRHLIIGDGLLQPVIKFVIGGGPMRSVINFSER